MVDNASTVWRDYNTDGVPSSGAHKPEKAAIRAWGGNIETSLVDVKRQSLGAFADDAAAEAYAAAYSPPIELAAGLYYFNETDNLARYYTGMGWVYNIGPGYVATSSTSLAIGLGTKTFTTQAGLAYQVGSRIRMIYTGGVTNYMEGAVTAYSGTSMTISVDGFAGSGTFASWTLNVAGSLGIIAPINWTPNTVRVRSTANVVIASALENGDTLNGLTLETGDNVFLGSQTDPKENGIYTVVASGAASRATWADSAAELARIGFVIQDGDVGASEGWTLSLDAGSITVGTTALNFSPVPGGVSPEIIAARGSFSTLGDRLDANDDVTAGIQTLGLVLPVLPAPADIFADFSLDRYYRDGVSPLDFSAWVAANSGTFTRGGSDHSYIDASGNLVQGSANQPRFSHDAVTGVPALLYEPASSNMIVYSQEVANGAWAFGGAPDVTRTSNGAVGIDGGMTGGLVRETATTAIHKLFYWNAAGAMTAGLFYAFQFIFRPEGRKIFRIVPSPITFGLGGVTIFDTDAMTISGAGASGWHIEEWPNGGIRIWKSFTAASSVIFSFEWHVNDDTGTDSYLGDISKGYTLLGSMLEPVASAGLPPTTYIHRATTSAASRSADSLTIDLPDTVSKITYTLGGGTQQIVAVSPGSYTVPALNSTAIKSMISVDLSEVGSPVTSVAGRIGDVTLAQADIAGLTTADVAYHFGLSMSGDGGIAFGTATAAPAVLKAQGPLFQWTSASAPSLTSTWRGVLIGNGAGSGLTTAGQSNAVAIGPNAAAGRTSIPASVVIGDTAGSGTTTPISNSVLIGNEAGNGPGNITSSNIIGNVTRLGYTTGTAVKVDVMGVEALRYNGATDTVAIGYNVGRGSNITNGNINQSVLIGSQAGNLSGAATLTNLFMIGYNVQAPTAGTSNYLNFGNFLKGDLSTAKFALTKQDGSAAELSVDKLVLGTKTPASATDTGTAGTICKDDNYIYVCTATNTWKRVAISTW